MHRSLATAMLLTGATLCGCSAKDAAKTDSLKVAQAAASEVAIVRLAPGKTMQDVAALFAKPGDTAFVERFATAPTDEPAHITQFRVAGRVSYSRPSRDRADDRSHNC